MTGRQFERFRCPDNDRGPQPDGGGRPDIIGCGRFIDGAVIDFEGLIDCPHCGMWFRADEDGVRA